MSRSPLIRLKSSLVQLRKLFSAAVKAARVHNSTSGHRRQNKSTTSINSGDHVQQLQGCIRQKVASLATPLAFHLWKIKGQSPVGIQITRSAVPEGFLSHSSSYFPHQRIDAAVTQPPWHSRFFVYTINFPFPTCFLTNNHPIMSILQRQAFVFYFEGGASSTSCASRCVSSGFTQLMFSTAVSSSSGQRPWGFPWKPIQHGCRCLSRTVSD